MNCPLMLLDAAIYHTRLHPKIHKLKHHIFYFMIDLDHIDTINQYPLMNYNKFNLWSIHTKDYGFDGDGLNPQRFKDIQNKYQLKYEKIYLVTVPRFLGHSFNPVSFFLFYDANSQLCAIVSEVHNTFGERHCYLSRHSDNSPIKAKDHIEAEKIFHVSPFFPVSGFYKFLFDDRLDRLNIKIDYYDENHKKLATGISAVKKKFTKYKPITLAIRFPFISFKILALIHYHAVILWFKKIRFFKKPPPPSQQISS